VSCITREQEFSADCKPGWSPIGHIRGVPSVDINT